MSNKLNSDFANFTGIGNSSHGNTIPIQALPSRYKNKDWRKATIDALEREGLKQIRSNIRFTDYRKLSSYIGICPRLFESGSSVKGKTRICKMGMSRIRAMLYMCSWSAKRCNKTCRELYERLIAKGKAKKQALIAVANKLLK